MNALIIGNGFDLAHGLPTRYADFLEAIEDNDEVKDYFWQEKDRGELACRVKKSQVYEYLKAQLQNNDGWVDFERELYEIINSACEFSAALKQTIDIQNGISVNLVLADSKANEQHPFVFRMMHQNGCTRTKWSYNEFKQLERNIQCQIQDFIDLFKQYILWVIECKMKDATPKKLFQCMEIDHLLSFNYTNTFLALYDSKEGEKRIPEENICYVHGKAEREAKNGIVMGAGSEFYNEDKHEKYVEFFKFFQCYKFKTSRDYLNWPKEVIWREKDKFTLDEAETRNKVMIYGHSLDPTDKDILTPFFNNPNAGIVIYYVDMKSKDALERNLLKILGKELFMEYLTGERPKVVFQQVPRMD